jgi:hypothetical protein
MRMWWMKANLHRPTVPLLVPGLMRYGQEPEAPPRQPVSILPVPAIQPGVAVSLGGRTDTLEL